MAAKARRIPKGEKSADTIAYQKTVIVNLTRRIEDLVEAKGAAEQRMADLERQVRSITESHNNMRERLREKESDIKQRENEIARLSGYIQRVREVERKDGEPHEIGNSAPDLASLVRR